MMKNVSGVVEGIELVCKHSENELQEATSTYIKLEIISLLDELEKYIKIVHNSNWRKKSLLMKKIQELKK